MNFDSIYNIMEEAFPNIERRSYENQKKLLNNEKYHIYSEFDNFGNLLGFLAYWDLDTCLFWEHLAINKKFRGQGLGSNLVKKHISNAKKNIILEVEPTLSLIMKFNKNLDNLNLELLKIKDNISIKRINFYKKFGFNLNEFYYEQPALQADSKSQQLMIMSYPAALSESEFFKYKKDIYYNIYNIKI